jgi:uncharacterized membrane protein
MRIEFILFGIILLFIGMTLLLLRRNTIGDTKGLILIGPIPIILNTNKPYLLLISIIVIVIILLLAFLR